MKPTILELTPMLETDDLEGTVHFYTKTLGFEEHNYSIEAGWVTLKRDDIMIMFTKHNEHRNFKKPIMSGSLYFRVNHVDPIWLDLRGKCDICYPLENFEYGMREFAIYDNNSYLLQFGQEIGK